MRSFLRGVLGLGALAVLTLSLGAADSTPRLKVSGNSRFLVTESGSPFFYLGDTAWELFHRLSREETLTYLDDRKAKAFTVIQAVAIAEFDGHKTANHYGHLPLIDLDPTRPATVEGPQNDYWDHVDFVVREANRRGLYLGFLPTWGRYWHDKTPEEGPIFTTRSAEIYGEWLGRRYREAGLIWILGGDRPVETPEQREIVLAMARGLARGDSGHHLMTFHPPGGAGSSKWFHAEDWLAFNMRQNGHGTEFTGRYDQTRVDYERQPVKPVIDGEPIYEGHPVSFNARGLGHSLAADIRRALYWDLFSGAFGHTYGHHSIWQFWTMDRPPINNPIMTWTDALQAPGAGQLQHARHLLESRPFLTRVPDDSILVQDRVPTNIPGAGRYRFVATRDQDGTYAMIYAPVGRGFRVQMKVIRGPKVRAWWFNPRDGSGRSIGMYTNQGEQEFTPPDAGELTDWVLVLDDASKSYPMLVKKP